MTKTMMKNYIACAVVVSTVQNQQIGLFVAAAYA